MWHWLLNVTGIHIGPNGNPWYNFWSGFGSDLGEVILLGSVITLYRRHKCTNCWRLAHHRVQGTHYKTCHKHATKQEHLTLHNKHATEYPDQHEFLNGDVYEY